MFLWSLVVAPWQLFAAAIVSGAGWAATSGAAIIAMVSPWFDRRRALALGHAFNGASLGGVLFTPLWAGLIARVGFAPAVAIVGLVTVTALLPLAGSYLGRTPQSLGLTPDGEPQASVRGPNESPISPPVRFATLIHDVKFGTLSASFALAM